MTEQRLEDVKIEFYGGPWDGDIDTYKLIILPGELPIIGRVGNKFKWKYVYQAVVFLDDWWEKESKKEPYPMAVIQILGRHENE